jgi:ABC-type uncharacterized transport system permease subunit
MAYADHVYLMQNLRAGFKSARAVVWFAAKSARRAIEMVLIVAIVLMTFEPTIFSQFVKYFSTPDGPERFSAYLRHVIVPIITVAVGVAVAMKCMFGNALQPREQEAKA